MNGKQIIVNSVITVLSLGLIGGGLVFAIKSMREKDDREKTSKKEKTPQIPEPKEKKEFRKIELKQKEIEIPDVLDQSYDSARELLKDVLYYLLKTRKYSDPEVLLEDTLNLLRKMIEDYSWYDEMPKNINDLERSIDDFDFRHLYYIAFEFDCRPKQS